MKKIKKLLAIAVATVMMTATLVGCGQSKESTGSSESNSSDVDLCQYIRHKKLNFLCNFSS